MGAYVRISITNVLVKLASVVLMIIIYCQENLMPLGNFGGKICYKSWKLYSNTQVHTVKPQVERENTRQCMHGAKGCVFIAAQGEGIGFCKLTPFW